MSYTPSGQRPTYPTGPGPYPYDNRRPSTSYPPPPSAERLPPMLEQPPRYQSSQQYSPFPSYGDMSRVYQSQTPPLPPPHVKYDYRYTQHSALPGSQIPYASEPPLERDFDGQYKKRKLSSDISVYSLSAQNGPGEDGAVRSEGYLRNTATPNTSTPSSTERPSVESQSSRVRSAVMTEQDKHELKKEKNREKQRRLRSRRAEQLNNLEHLNNEKDARLEHLEAKVKRLETEAIQKDEKWQRWVLELENRLGHSRRRSRLLENSNTGKKERDEEINNSILREIGDIRIRFGVAPFEGMARPSFSGSSDSVSEGRLDDRMSGLFHASVGMPSTEEQRLRVDPPSATLAPSNQQSSSSQPYRQSESPLSLQAPLSPDQRKSLNLSPRAFDDAAKENTAIVTPIEDPRSIEDCQTMVVDSAEQVAEFMSSVDPSIAMPYLKLFDQLQDLRDHSFQLRDTPVAMDTADNRPSPNPASTAAQPAYSVADMSEADILNLTESSLLHIARSLIREKLPISMYTPRVGVWNTSMEEERRALSLRSRNPSDTTLVEGDNLSTRVRPPWRNVFTPSEIYILYRALMFACHPTGSKAFFDEKRISELSPSQKTVYERWATYEGRDKRVDMIPAMIFRMVIILNNELRGQPELDVTALLNDSLHEAVIYGNAWSMYTWELPDSFWSRWGEIFPGGKEFCSSLRAWRRKDRHSGSRPFEIIMGTEDPKARTGGGLELPAAGWSDGVVTDNDAGTAGTAQLE
ncbi:hypothetical protein NliqN6_6156 [Naganishia liquefaciens]|uniref:BZIP domain-containing protein n=1 Tax=Naganishia liquefaciens TaxID=104408 RepID=A0A8H3YHD7_9TREE|nr:hypothetical protein NliqN6_6156 [Naganishia liquefaciens]